MARRGPSLGYRALNSDVTPVVCRKAKPRAFFCMPALLLAHVRETQTLADTNVWNKGVH